MIILPALLPTFYLASEAISCTLTNSHDVCELLVRSNYTVSMHLCFSAVFNVMYGFSFGNITFKDVVYLRKNKVGMDALARIFWNGLANIVSFIVFGMRPKENVNETTTEEWSEFRSQSNDVLKSTKVLQCVLPICWGVLSLVQLSYLIARMERERRLEDNNRSTSTLRQKLRRFAVQLLWGPLMRAAANADEDEVIAMAPIFQFWCLLFCFAFSMLVPLSYYIQEEDHEFAAMCLRLMFELNVPTWALYLVISVFTNLHTESYSGAVRAMLLANCSLLVLANTFYPADGAQGENEGKRFAEGSATSLFLVATAVFVFERWRFVVHYASDRERDKHIVGVVAKIAVTQMPLSILLAAEYYACLSRGRIDMEEEGGMDRCEDLKAGMYPILSISACFCVAQVAFVNLEGTFKLDNLVRLNLSCLEICQALLGIGLTFYSILLFGLRQEDKRAQDWKIIGNQVFSALLFVLAATFVIQAAVAMSAAKRDGKSGILRNTATPRRASSRVSVERARRMSASGPVKVGGALAAGGKNRSKENLFDSEEMLEMKKLSKISIWDGGIKHVNFNPYSEMNRSRAASAVGLAGEGGHAMMNSEFNPGYL
jgi:hypothetical protein